MRALGRCSRHALAHGFSGPARRAQAQQVSAQAAEAACARRTEAADRDPHFGRERLVRLRRGGKAGHQQAPARIAQLVQRAPQAVAPVQPLALGIRARRAVLEHAFVHDGLGESETPAIAAPNAEGAALRRGREPAREAIAVAQVRKRAYELGERVLEDLLGVGGLQAERARNPVHEPPVAIDEHAPTARVAARARRDELGIAGLGSFREMFSHRRNTLTDLGTPPSAADPRREGVLLRRSGDACQRDRPVSNATCPPAAPNLLTFLRGRPCQSPAPGSPDAGSTAWGGTRKRSNTASSNPSAGAEATRGRTNGRAARAGGVPSGVSGALHGSPGRHRLPPQLSNRRRGMFDPSNKSPGAATRGTGLPASLGASLRAAAGPAPRAAPWHNHASQGKGARPRGPDTTF